MEDEVSLPRDSESEQMPELQVVESQPDAAQSPPVEKPHVVLVDAMPRENPDQAIADAARVSYGKGTKRVSNDKGLIRYLMRHQHMTPFEMVTLKFRLRMPIFVEIGRAHV